MKLNEIEVFFEEVKFTNEPIQLNQCETVINQEEFVKSHISALKKNTGNKTYLPYYDRLMLFKKKFD